MIELLKLAIMWARQFNDEGLHFILMILALIYIALNKNEKVHRRLFLGYSLVFIFLYFFPPVIWFMVKLIGQNVYWRMMWLLPLPIIIAYAMVKVWAATKGKVKKAVEFLVFVGLLAVMGQILYIEDSPFETRVNWGKVPGSPAAICSIINEYRGTPDEWVMLAAPEDMVPYIVMYDASIQQIYGRKGLVLSNYIMKALDDEVLDYPRLTEVLRKHECNYIVLPDGEGRIEGMAEYGFEQIGTVGTYIVYKDMEWMPQD